MITESEYKMALEVVLAYREQILEDTNGLEEPIGEELADMPLNRVGLPVRAFNAIIRSMKSSWGTAATTSLRDVIKQTNRRDIAMSRNVGSKTMKEIDELIKRAGLKWNK